MQPRAAGGGGATCIRLSPRFASDVPASRERQFGGDVSAAPLMPSIKVRARRDRAGEATRPAGMQPGPRGAAARPRRPNAPELRDGNRAPR